MVSPDVHPLPAPQDWDVAVVLRSSGERTVSACRALLGLAAPQLTVLEVTRCPFSEALRESYEMGIASGRRWTVAIDGDVLLGADAIARLAAFAERQPPGVFLCQGFLLDKLFCGPRLAGLHFYRTELLASALADFPANLQAQLRPESHVIDRMRKRGHPSRVLKHGILGIHDHDQYFRDIYRKAFIHARKHPQCLRLLAPHWEALGTEDPDFLVALVGARAGAAFPWDLPIDIRVLPTEIAPLLPCLGLTEKAPAPPSEWSLELVDEIIASHRPLPRSGLLQQLTGTSENLSLPARIGNVREAVGLSRLFPWFLGSKLRNLGSKMVAWAERGPRVF